MIIKKYITIEFDEKSLKEMLPNLPDNAFLVRSNFLPISKKIVIEFYLKEE